MHVLLATDQSISSQAAAEMAGVLKFQKRPELTIISAVPVAASVGFSGLPPVVMSVMQEEQVAIKQHLETLGGELASNYDLRESVLVIGPPGYEIKSHVESSDVDLIVMGAVGKSMIERVVLGSVSDFVATHVDCNVLVVRADVPQDSSTPAAAVTAPQRIMLALDNSDADKTLVEFVRQFQWADGSELHLVHVMEDFAWYQRDVADHLHDHWDSNRRDADQHARDIKGELEDRFGSMQTSIVIEPHVGEGLTRYADRHACDLIITGDHHRGLLDRLLLGSTSRYVLRYAHCSVAIARS